MFFKKYAKFIALGFLVALTTIVLDYFWTYTKAEERAYSFLEGNEVIEVRKDTTAGTEFYVFEIKNNANRKDEKMVFYSGGKVEYLAYAELCFMLAEEEYTVYLPKLRFNLAFFDIDVADKFVKLEPANTNWILIGHSLGGVAMANYAAKNDHIVGLVFLASYSATDLSNTDIKSLVLSAEFDGLTTKIDIDKAKENFNEANTLYLEFAGGNHANFGDYGIQIGDGVATILKETQFQWVVSNIIEYFYPTD
jgi:hypothetical protein